MAYLSANKLRLTINSQNVFVQTSNLDGEIGEIDFTNTESAKDALNRVQFEGGTDVMKRTINFTCFLDSASLHTFNEGIPVAASWTITGGHAWSGSFTLLRKSSTGGPRGAHMVTGSGFLSGNVTET